MMTGLHSPSCNLCSSSQCCRPPGPTVGQRIQNPVWPLCTKLDARILYHTREEEKMTQIDLVFEGGGAKGMVFAGALEVLFADDSNRSCGRLLGTSAGAITAVSLAAGYTPAEILEALGERGPDDKPVFESFLGFPPPFDEGAIRESAIFNLLASMDLPLVPDRLDERIDLWITRKLATTDATRHLFSFIERGGWYSADAFVDWLGRKLDEEKPDGTPRGYSKFTLSEFFEATGVELTVVAADTTGAQMLLLNHRTAPHCPVVWAARMSMSVPLLWQEVEWLEEWGDYYSWNPETARLEPESLKGHAIVDGGLLSNFPIALFLSDRPDVAAVVGPAASTNVLGLLIDESLPVPNRPPRPDEGKGSDLAGLQTVQRLRGLLNTATKAHDNLAIAAFAQHVVHLPAGGYSTTQFDMTDEEREALVAAGKQAMEDYLGERTGLEAAGPIFEVGSRERSLANEAALSILQR
jgi:predicted acylesterase/phospholipase RssA